jgi:hypothetical protein
MAAKPLREGLSPSNGGLDIRKSTHMWLGTDLVCEASKFFVKDAAGHQWFRPDENDGDRPGHDHCSLGPGA